MKSFLFLAVICLTFGYGLLRSTSKDIRDETTCQTHKRNAGGERALMHWNITCDAQGNYMPTQCTVETPRWCACYNKEGVVTRPSRSTQTCECLLKKDEATKAGAATCDIPECERSGEFKKKQCCQRTQKCHCVDRITGQPTTQPTANMNLVCV